MVSVTAKARLLGFPLCWGQGRRLATGDAPGREQLLAIVNLIQAACCPLDGKGLYYSTKPSGRGRNRVARAARRGTGYTHADEYQHLARVRSRVRIPSSAQKNQVQGGVSTGFKRRSFRPRA